MTAQAPGEHAAALRVILVVHPGESGEVKGCGSPLIGPQVLRLDAWPSLPGCLVEHTRHAADIVTACDVSRARVVVAFAGCETGELFHVLLRERPQVGRLLVVASTDARGVLAQVNESPFHHAVLGTPELLPTQSELLEAFVAVERRVLPAPVLPAQATRSLSPQSLGRRRPLALLSEREREVLWHLVKGARILDIAGRLHVSEHTVRNHIKAMFRKLDVHSQSELVTLARAPR